jgi:ATP-dependent exoDNAse (exonuclease V) alpha subunit
VYVANGEMGQVVRVEPKYFHVQLTTPRRLVVVPRGKAEEAPEDPAGDEDGNVEEVSSTGCDWDLAYAISVHKSQGSEFPVILYMVDESAGARRLCTREHIYTGISRAKQCCVLVGKLSVAQSFCKRTAIDKRKTFLAERIQEGMRTL